MAVRYTPYLGAIDEAERDRVRKHPLYQIGDTVLVWVNEGDLWTEAAKCIEAAKSES